MTPQLLVIKIQSLINGTSKFDNGQLKLLAAEYKKLYNQSAQRLEQCISLIKTNRDYLALELAESDNPLLDTINTISFAELPKWNEICEAKGIEVCPPFDEYYIELLQSLYTKNIGQTHPLYRDYRRAMRTHNFRNALKIISTISKINSKDLEIKQEYLRLLNTEIAHSFVKLKEALESNNKEEAISLYEFLENNDSEFDEDENNWQELRKAVNKIKKEFAIKHQGELLKDLKEVDAEKDWATCLNDIEEVKFLKEEYDLDISNEDLELIKTKQKIAETKKKEKDLELLKISTSAKVMSVLNSENRQVPAKARLALFKELRKDKDLIDNDTLKKLKKRISRLSKIIFFKRLTTSVSLACIIAVCVFGYFYTKEKLELEQRIRLASVQIAQLEDNNSVVDMQKAVEKYKSDFPEFLDKYEIELVKIERSIEMQGNYAKLIDSLFEKVENIEAINSVSIKAINADFASISDILDSLFEGDASIYAMKLDEIKKAHQLKLSELENNYESELKKAFAKASIIIDNLDFDTSVESIEEISQGKVSLKEIEEVIASNSDLFKPKDNYITKLGELKSKLSDEEIKFNKFSANKIAIANSYKLDDYFLALKDMQFNIDLASNVRKGIGDILSLAKELEYGSDVKNFTQEELDNASEIYSLQEPESLPSDLLDIADIYVYDNNAQKVYTQGKLKEEKTSSWTGGYEMKQTGKEFSDRGTSRFILNNMIVQGSRISRDTMYKNGKITKEAEFVNELQEEKHSILKLINIVQSSETDPIFKAWLESELFELAKQDPAKSGLMYSKAAQERAKLIKKNSIGLNNRTWLKQNPTKRKELEYSLYKERLVDLESDAMEHLSRARALLSKRARVIAFVDENGVFSTEDFPEGEIYAVDLQGREVLLIKDGKILTKAMPFSPLLIRD